MDLRLERHRLAEAERGGRHEQLHTQRRVGTARYDPPSSADVHVTRSTSTRALASTPPGTHPPIFWLGGRQREYRQYPPILLRTFGYSRPILVALRSLSLKPISFGYKTPPIRFSQAGGQSAHEARPPQPSTRVDLATAQGHCPLTNPKPPLR